MIDSCYVGDVRDGLRSFIAAGVRAQTCVTSPPYWGLRDYGHAGQIGLEPTPDEYVRSMVDVFGLVRDVLAPDGTLWLNLGDSYGHGTSAKREASKTSTKVSGEQHDAQGGRHGGVAKQLCGIPWRVAFALQADGWYLRSDIIWHKPNPMPESVTDRPTKAHEYMFLLAKSERYFYDAAAIAEPSAYAGEQAGICRGTKRRATAMGLEPTGNEKPGMNWIQPESRNRRTVWTITTESYTEAHFATFPTALVEPCILAGSRVGDVVLDPFMGSGTVAQVAQDLGRRWIGCELNPAYVELQKRRAAQLGMAFA